MKNLLLAICLLITIDFQPAIASPATPNDRRKLRSQFPPVIMYHEVREDKIYNSFDVRAENFRRQLEWLKEQGYQTLSLDELYSAYEQGDQETLSKAVVITFDDGYLGNYEVAAPILAELGMKATFFIHLDSINLQDLIPNYPTMNWTQVQELDRNPLFSVYSHSISHPHLSELHQVEQRLELQQSKLFYEDRLGGERPYFAYPYGNYDRRVIEEVQNAGYKLAFSVSDLGLFEMPVQFSIPRIYMGTIMSDLMFFQRCVLQYREMVAENNSICFEERWKPIDSATTDGDITSIY